MESSLPDDVKANLTLLRGSLNPVELQHNLNKAIDNLWNAHKTKVTFS
jgi:hypothetical protein